MSRHFDFLFLRGIGTTNTTHPCYLSTPRQQFCNRLLSTCSLLFTGGKIKVVLLTGTADHTVVVVVVVFQRVTAAARGVPGGRRHQAWTQWAARTNGSPWPRPSSPCSRSTLSVSRLRLGWRRSAWAHRRLSAPLHVLCIMTSSH